MLQEEAAKPVKALRQERTRELGTEERCAHFLIHPSVHPSSIHPTNTQC